MGEIKGRMTLEDELGVAGSYEPCNRRQCDQSLLVTTEWPATMIPCTHETPTNNLRREICAHSFGGNM